MYFRWIGYFLIVPWCPCHNQNWYYHLDWTDVRPILRLGSYFLIGSDFGPAFGSLVMFRLMFIRIRIGLMETIWIQVRIQCVSVGSNWPIFSKQIRITNTNHTGAESAGLGSLNLSDRSRWCRTPCRHKKTRFQGVDSPCMQTGKRLCSWENVSVRTMNKVLNTHTFITTEVKVTGL